MDTQPKLNSSKEVIAFLSSQFPACFCSEGEAKPLKIGIFQDLIARIPAELGLSKTQLRAALRMYTSSWRYLYGVKPGASRVDLDGMACGELEEQHIDHAKKQLQEAKARIRQREQDKKALAEPKKAKMLSTPPVAKVQKNTRVEQVKTRVKQEPKPQQLVTPVKNSGQLTIGQTIKVKAGQRAVDATILEISKDGVHVQLVSGLAMIVKIEHLHF